MPHSIGKTIKGLRHKRGFTQEELAERLGVTSLAYPTNPAYDKKNGEQLYESCLRHGEKVISYDQDVNHIMRARMIMLMLHCAYGNFTEARREAEKFPQRTDFNIYNMYAHIAHFKGDHKT